jgi:hypothetical protein
VTVPNDGQKTDFSWDESNFIGSLIGGEVFERGGKGEEIVYGRLECF